MKDTGIVRRIDSLGRIVIPKEVRKTLRIREGDALEIFVNHGGELILKKYSPIGELSDFAKICAQSLYETIGHVTWITDRDQIIAVSGCPERKYLNKPINGLVEKAMASRKAVLNTQSNLHFWEEGDTGTEGNGYEHEEWENKYTAEVIAPIIVEGDPIGAVVMASREPDIRFGDLELKSAETAASFLAKQMEQ